MDDLTTRCTGQGSFYILTTHMNKPIAFSLNAGQLSLYFDDYRINWNIFWGDQYMIFIYDPTLVQPYKTADRVTITRKVIDNMCKVINEAMNEQIWLISNRHMSVQEMIIKWVKNDFSFYKY